MLKISHRQNSANNFSGAINVTVLIKTRENLLKNRICHTKKIFLTQDAIAYCSLVSVLPGQINVSHFKTHEGLS